MDRIQVLPNTSVMSLIRKRSSSESCTVFSYHASLFSFEMEQFLSPSLTFMTLTFLKIIEHLFYSMSFNLCLTGTSWWLDPGYASLQKYHKSGIVFLFQTIRWLMILICSIADGIHFYHLIKVVSICQVSPLGSYSLSFCNYLIFYGKVLWNYLNIPLFMKISTYCYSSVLCYILLFHSMSYNPLVSFKILILKLIWPVRAPWKLAPLSIWHDSIIL